MDRERLLEELDSLPGRLGAITEDLGKAVAMREPAPGSWSILEIACHMRDQADILHSLVTRTLHEERPSLVLYDDLEMARSRDYASQDLGMVVSALRAIRSRTMELVRRLTEADLARRLDHPERGVVTLAWVLESWVDHDRRHLEEIEKLSRDFARGSRS